VDSWGHDAFLTPLPAPPGEVASPRS
jgi:hypothetical protein